jgi:hypothetical protein
MNYPGYESAYLDFPAAVKDLIESEIILSIILIYEKFNLTNNRL